MKYKITSLLALFTLATVVHGEDLAWFKKRYERTFAGVKPMKDYGDPDAYYKAIAAKLKIPEIAVKAASKKLGWKKGDPVLMHPKANRGPSSFLKDAKGKPLIVWDVLITRFPLAPGQKKLDMKSINAMKMYYLELNDDLKVVSIHRIEKGKDGKKTLIDLAK